MKIKHIILFTLTVLLAGACQKSTTEKENDAVFKTIKKVYELNSDGSMNFQYQHQLKYITHFSFNRLYGESFIIYNPDYQEIRFNKIETTMADGKIVKAPENAFNEVLPRFAAGAPAFNHLREMVVTHTGLELGCTVNFDYELHSKAGYLPFLNENIILQEEVPVENLEIVVKVPEGTELNYKLLNSNAQVKITNKDGYTHYTWKFKNLKNKAHESHQPKDQQYLPRLIFTNATMADALQEVSKNDFSLNNKMKKIVTKRITGKKKEIHIIRALQKLVGSEINDFHIPLDYARYSARPLEDVWQSNGATGIEKNMLLNELLNYSGIESQLIYAIPSFYFDQKLGVLNGTGDFYNLVKANNEDFIIDANSNQTNNLALLLEDNVILDLEAETLTSQEELSEIDPKIEIKGTFEINTQGDLDGKLDLDVIGVKSPYLNYLDDVDNAKEVVQSVFPKNTIQKFEVYEFDQKGSKMQAKIDHKDVWKNQGNYYFLTLPESEFGIKGEHLNFLIEERQTPLQLSQEINELYNYSLKLPDGFVFTAPSIEKELENDLGSVFIKINAESNVLKIDKKLKVNRSIINPEEYSQFKDLLEIWNNKTFREIILKKE